MKLRIALELFVEASGEVGQFAVPYSYETQY
ncbi:hypothetical protein QE357_003239 [Siphonobacter sp. BAB-5404]|nr:hypothetical protein [Siphonobacter sp. SORGH_AS_0500]